MTAARDDVLRALRARLLSGDRRELGEATAVAREALDDPGLLSLLVDCLEDGDATVVSHAAHAAMQVSRDRPELFQLFAGRLTGILAASPVWEIGEQLPKILARLDLDPAQAAQLQAVLERKVESESAIAAASALTALVELAGRGLIDPGDARRAVEKALSSPRKAVAARARRLLAS